LSSFTSVAPITQPSSIVTSNAISIIPMPSPADQDTDISTTTVRLVLIIIQFFSLTLM
jgi:hypothetical protein